MIYSQIKVKDHVVTLRMKVSWDYTYATLADKICVHIMKRCSSFCGALTAIKRISIWLKYENEINQYDKF